MDPTGADKTRLRLPQKVTQCCAAFMAKLLHSLPLYACVAYNLDRRLSVPTCTGNVINPNASSFPALDFIQLLDSDLCRTLCRLRRGSLSTFESETQADVAYFTAAIYPSRNRNEVRYDSS